MKTPTEDTPKTRRSVAEDTRRRAAIADIHRMKALLGLTDDAYRQMLSGWGVGSSALMTDAQLAELRTRLHDLTDPRTSRTGRVSGKHDSEMILWRRRVYAVVGQWLHAMGYPPTAQAIRTTVCRATHADSFNSVSLSQLKQVYHSWCRKRDMAVEADAILTLRNVNLN